MNYNVYPVDRYGRPMEEILLSYLNHRFMRNFSGDDIQFKTPVKKLNGEVSVGLEIHQVNGECTDSGWCSIRYTREKIEDVVPNGQLTIHSTENTVQAIRGAILEQYGIYLDIGTYELVIDDDQIPTDPDGEGDGGVGDGGSWDIDPDASDPDGAEGVPNFTTQWYTLTFNDNHLLFEGSLRVRIEPSIELLGTSIGRTIDLRTYYTDVHAGKYPTELYMSNMQWVENDQAQWLFDMKPDAIPHPRIAERLSALSGDTWVSSEAPAPFNTYGMNIIYNGLVIEGKDDISFPYVMVLELSDEHCSNLTGVITVFYRYTRPQRPGLWGKPNSSSS